MKRTTPITVVVLISAAALVGCGGDKPLTEQSFDSAADLRTAVAEAGVPCDNEEVNQGEGYKESINCGDNVWLTVFDNQEDKQARTERYDEQKSKYVSGENWVVVAPQESLDKIQD